MASKTGTELFLVDNSAADWKVLRYLYNWCQLAKGIDIAAGYFEIGSFLALKDEWQKVGHTPRHHVVEEKTLYEDSRR